ncbi:MAG: AI-2E family transporter [Parcubacteria group bacterium]|nr:AI-2E family transporter [Parcubacteria group bacterium]
MEFKKIRSYTFIGVLIGITLVFLWMLRPYVYSVFWAAVIATMFYPLHGRIVRLLRGKKSLATSLTVVLIVLIFLIPLAGVVSLIVQQALSLYDTYGNQETIDRSSMYLQSYLNHSWAQRALGEDFDVAQKLEEWSASISNFLYQYVTSWGQNTLRVVIQFFVMMYALYYFLKDGEGILRKLMYLLPLGDQYEKILFARFVSTARATLKGTVIIGLIQGVVGGLAFLVTGVPGAAFWGLIMIILSIIPAVGAFVVLLPAAVVMFAMGNIWQAVVILVALIVASSIDNFLRGPLVGKDAQMHPLFIFFATLGGLLSFGISGVVIGPVLAAFLLSIWEIYEQKYKPELDKAD